MTKAAKQSAAAWIGLGLAIAGLIWQGGVIHQQVSGNSKGLEKCAVKVDKHSEDIAEIKADLKALLRLAERKWGD